MKKLLAVFLMVLSTATFARQGDLSTVINTYGYHWENNNNQNNKNFGIGLQYEFIERFSLGAKVYNNSLDRNSTALVATARVWENKDWQLNMAWQIADNYQTRKYNQDTKQFIIGNVCRRLTEDFKLVACLSANIWQQGEFTPYSNLSFKYTF